MAKNAVGDWSTTAANNTDVGGIGITGGNLPSNLDDALREIMAQIATYRDLIDEDGSNSNGDYVRLIDGTQICWQSVTATNTNVASGSLFWTTADVTWTFPAAFVGVPRVFYGATRNDRIVGGSSTGSPSTTAVTYRPWSSVSLTGTFSIQLLAIGKY